MAKYDPQPGTEWLEPSERVLWEQFLTKHRVKCNTEAVIDWFQTGIGTNITARCPCCGDELDITDYGAW